MASAGHPAAATEIHALPKIRETQRSGEALAPPVVQGGGAPLPAESRARMESRFRQDLSGVRVHTGTAAETACKSVRAHAYTFGEDIYFGRSRYRPSTPAGDRLLAHELTHVLQQRGSGVERVQREVDQAELKGSTFKVRMAIGIFARPSLYEGAKGLAGSGALEKIAARWKKGIDSNWSGPVPCHDGEPACNLEMNATVRAYPDARNRYQVPEANVVRVMPSDYHSNVVGWWGSWAHSDDGVTAAHEVGHMLGLADKYWQVGGQKSFKGFVGDLMGNYNYDLGALGKRDFGPARARLMRLHGAVCPGCASGQRVRPVTGPES